MIWVSVISFKSGTLDLFQWHIGRFLLRNTFFAAGLLSTSFKCKQKMWHIGHFSVAHWMFFTSMWLKSIFLLIKQRHLIWILLFLLFSTFSSIKPLIFVSLSHDWSSDHDWIWWLKLRSWLNQNTLWETTGSEYQQYFMYTSFLLLNQWASTLLLWMFFLNQSRQYYVHLSTSFISATLMPFCRWWQRV